MRRAFALALAILSVGSASAQSVRVHVLQSLVDSDLIGALRTAGHVVTTGQWLDWYTGAPLPPGTQVVYATLEYTSSIPSGSGLITLKQFCAAGGGLVFDGSFRGGALDLMPTMAGVLPVTSSSTIQTGGNGYYLNRSASNPILNAGLSSEIPFVVEYPGNNWFGWTPKPGATTYYELVNNSLAARIPAVVGGSYERGKVMFHNFRPYYDWHYEVPHTALLLSNIVKWAARPASGFLALQNTADGTLTSWTLNGWSSTGSVPLNVSPGAQHKVVQTADFNLDGQVDFGVADTASNDGSFWYAGVKSIRGSAKATAQYPAPWKIIGYGDVDNDRFPDTFYANGSTVGVLKATGFIPMGWSGVATSSGSLPVGVGDFNKDGKSDVLFRSSSNGQLFYLRLNGTKVLGSTYITPVPVGAQTIAVGDVDGDGRSEIALQNDSTRTIWGWKLNDAGNTATQTLVGTPSAGYKLRALGLWQ